MRTLINAAFLASFLQALGFAGSAFAADLGPYDEPEPGPPVGFVPPPVAVLPPPQVPIAVVAPPRCGFYRPCFRPYARDYFGPGPSRFYARPYAYEKPAYAPIGREGYGYDYDRDRFERAHRHFSRYGYDQPREDGYEPRRSEPRHYERRERVERLEGGRPYADPLGHDGYERRRGERYDRGPDYGPGPYDRG